jgi:hypothetical protein
MRTSKQCLLCGGACTKLEAHLAFDYGYSDEDDEMSGYVRGEKPCPWCGGDVTCHAVNCPELLL